ncbi:MAG: bifunctional 5,10-methylenetetrahydrofolate dehydrogenase/5,10-methenyltetrahydrofolate cyclohydrolase [Candidatus Omnitrophica bacterium]|nr:bifunctional 5,10-methylenetetrahydrofolate dehydrogenase/5,10-methenyltetrahydrofolate cyclohydrolase [Candidatus Omnitrophota bacterium]
MATIIDGTVIAEKILSKVKVSFDEFKGRSLPEPKLVSSLVGYGEEGQIYVNAQKRAADKIGVNFEVKDLSKKIDTEMLLEIVRHYNNDDTVTAVIIQQPLPGHIDNDEVISTLSPCKDAEGIHPYNLGRIFRREADIVPCTPGAVMKILTEMEVDLYGKNVVIIGHSPIVGKPLSLMMLNEFATTSVCHIGTYKSGEIQNYSRKADILVVAVGKPALVNADWIKDGAFVIDVGINNLNGKVVGDVDFDGVKNKVSAITPVPGGVGPVTVAILMRNVLRAYRNQHGKIQK